MHRGDRGDSQGAYRCGKRCGKESWLDFIAVPAEKYAEYVDYLNRLAPDYVCAHLGSDIYEKEGGASARAQMFEKIGELKFTSKLVLSGGISLADIPAIKKVHPHHVQCRWCQLRRRKIRLLLQERLRKHKAERSRGWFYSMQLIHCH